MATRNPLHGLLAALLLNLTGLAVAAEPAPQVIRLGVPDASVGQHSSSGTATVDYAYVQRLFEQEFAKDGIEIRWAFFKNAGPAINEAFANEQIDFAFLGDLAAIIGESAGNRTRLLAATSRGLNGYSAWYRAAATTASNRCAARPSACGSAPPGTCRWRRC